ncbi:hypothetical protein ACCO45_010150 [Purpureocillium lilacinum]|uniref:Uncharacterized protein n=1 Tax=Purpureocillium lilacinum TaxID=33203 RepID=A0ACC4DFJ1_PURLI
MARPHRSPQRVLCMKVPSPVTTTIMTPVSHVVGVEANNDSARVIEVNLCLRIALTSGGRRISSAWRKLEASATKHRPPSTPAHDAPTVYVTPSSRPLSGLNLPDLAISAYPIDDDNKHSMKRTNRL